jgi:hypothetical protein
MKRLLLILILTLPVMVFGVSWGNGTPVAYNENANTGSALSLPMSQQSMDSLVIQGATCFLKSSSDYTLFLQRYEQNSADFTGLQNALNDAISGMKATVSAFHELTKLAVQTPYNQPVISQLSAFDYQGFLKEKGLFNEVFNSVKSFLTKGDVTGSYVEILGRATELVNRMNSIRQDLNNGIIPDILTLWDINQEYSELMFFGQYESMIFKAAVKQ